uniref:Pinin_SDK_N domain-containing protein n=1 Tax=Macrostomum lignano TaxID=282301 RepID=A0A1I8FQV7_9PLAT
MASKILSLIKSISSKDPSSTAIAISNVEDKEKAPLLKVLEQIDKSSEKKEKTANGRNLDIEKERREVRFIARLKEKMNSIHDRNEEIVIKTRFGNARNMCFGPVQADETSMRKQFTT